MENQQQVITLNEENSTRFLVQFIEVAQQKGAYLLQEAELLKRAADVATNVSEDKEINQVNARQLLVQGVHKGQRAGAYSLNDAAMLSKVVQFVMSNVEQKLPHAEPENVNSFDDLADLSEPIPLKPKEV
jgi:hypothetical protein